VSTDLGRQRELSWPSGKSERKNFPTGSRGSAFLVLWRRLRCFMRERAVAVAVGVLIGASIANTGARVTSGVVRLPSGLWDRRWHVHDEGRSETWRSHIRSPNLAGWLPCEKLCNPKTNCTGCRNSCQSNCPLCEKLRGLDTTSSPSRSARLTLAFRVAVDSPTRVASASCFRRS